MIVDKLYDVFKIKYCCIVKAHNYFSVLHNHLTLRKLNTMFQERILQLQQFYSRIVQNKGAQAAVKDLPGLLSCGNGGGNKWRPKL